MWDGEPETCVETGQGQQGKPRGRRNASRPTATVPDRALERDTRAVAERYVQGAASQTSGDRKARRRQARAWYPDGDGSIRPAGGATGAAGAMGPDVLDPQPRLPTETLTTWG